MRPIDLVPFVLVALAAMAVFFPRRPLTGPARYLPLAALAVAGVHLGVAYRNALIPVYGLALLTAVSTRPTSYERLGLRRAVGVAGLVALGTGAVLAWAFPLFSLPAPGGPYAVGTRVLFLTDSSRAEELSAEPDDKRTLLVRLWYPADSTGGAPQPLLSEGRTQQLAVALSLPPFTLNHLARIPSHSHADVPLSTRQPQWPLVLFSHGYGIGYESQNTVQMEALASHGYVVASIAHPWESAAVTLPDGRVSGAAPAPAMPDSAAMAHLMAQSRRLATEQDTSELLGIVRLMQERSELNGSIGRWTDDTRFVLDQLTLRSTPGARDTLFTGRLVTERVGVFGMSFGGATAANFCTLDVRCAAGMNLDGLTYGEATDVPLPRPFFFVAGFPNRQMHQVFFQRATAPAWSMVVARTQHYDFTDLGFISPLFARLGVLGGIEASRMHTIMNTALLGFLGEHLQGRPFDAATLTRYEEVTLDRRPALPPAAAAPR